MKIKAAETSRSISDLKLVLDAETGSSRIRVKMADDKERHVD
jgi:hypothetical protein